MKTYWSHLKKGESGSRFIDCYQYKQDLRRKYGSYGKVLDLAMGGAIVFVGIVLIPAPGPGFIIVALGLALIAGESKVMAKFLDLTERNLRRLVMGWKRAWRQASLVVKSALALAASSLAVGIGYGAYLAVQALWG